LMQNTSKDREMRERLLAIDILRELKRTYTYKELSRIFGLQESLLCRYVNGTTVPSEQQARELLSWTTNRDFLQKFFKDKIKIYPDSFIDTSELLHYPSLLRLAMEPILSKFGRVDKVFSIATNGVPFATMASMILGKPLLVAKKHKDSIYLEYLEESMKEADSVVTNVYVRKNFVSKDDRILIVDDVMKTGKTIRSSISLISKGGGTVAGILLIVAQESSFRDLTNYATEVMFKI